MVAAYAAGEHGPKFTTKTKGTQRSGTADNVCPAYGQRLPPQVSEVLTLDRVLAEQVGPLGIPAWQGALIGHVERQFTVPIGVQVEIDATRGAIQLLEPAVC